MMVKMTSKGSFANVERFLLAMTKGQLFADLDSFAKDGVAALSEATPIESGETAASWFYEIELDDNGTSRITWKNSHVVDGVNIAIILEYGHGTGTGGYVQGREYINSAIQPVMDKLADNVWKAVTSA